MKLSIVIVNYNVRYFLQNCLNSVRDACKNIDAEVFVVDNNSVDGSLEMLQAGFPEVKVIANKVNLGFSMANNQAIAISKGEYVLLLNPDTVVEEDTFSKCIEFMDAHPDTGGLGIKMIDGSGSFLPESKRGLPRPKVAFYKIFGMSRLFPRSKKFGHYHLGYIGENETAEIEILSGAYMFLRNSVIKEIGALDESFFMYGEDIDLSYRIVKAGYKNYYFPEARIIHYKGESTKKSSVNYVFVFYRAMVIFARKHFSKQRAWLFSMVINTAIYLRAFIAICQRFISRLALPLFDGSLLILMMYGIKEIYEKKIKFAEGGQYPEEIIMISLPAMALIWVLSNTLFGAYLRPYRNNKLLRGISAGSIIILIIYALLNESVRFSRVLVLIYCLATFLVLPASRILLSLLGLYERQKPGKRLAITGMPDEIARVEKLLEETEIQPETIIRIDPREATENYLDNYTGSFYQLKDLCGIYHITEIIFCSRDIDNARIISFMSENAGKIEFKIAPPDSQYIIGSSSNETSGEYYIVGAHSLSQPGNKRKKRIFDVVASGFFLLTSPFLMVLFDRPLAFVGNLWKILTNNLTFVGLPDHYSDKSKFSKVKKGVLTPFDNFSSNGENNSEEVVHRYANHYAVRKDLELVMKAFRKLDRKTI